MDKIVDTDDKGGSTDVLDLLARLVIIPSADTDDTDDVNEQYDLDDTGDDLTLHENNEVRLAHFSVKG